MQMVPNASHVPLLYLPALLLFHTFLQACDLHQVPDGVDVSICSTSNIQMRSTVRPMDSMMLV